MPKLVSSEKVLGPKVTIRLTYEENEFHRLMARRSGKTLTQYLKELIVEGGLAVKVAEIEDRLSALVNRIADSGGRSASPGLSEEALFSLYSMHETIRNTVTERDPKEWEAASKSARAKVDQEVGRVRKS
jgi:predicted DNA-binding protein